MIIGLMLWIVGLLFTVSGELIETWLHMACMRLDKNKILCLVRTFELYRRGHTCRICTEGQSTYTGRVP